MSTAKLPRFQDELFSTDAVERFSKSKLSELDEMQAQVIIDTLEDIEKFAGKRKLGTLLDVGCGRGVATSLMAKHFDRAIGVDLSVNQIKKANGSGHPDHIEFKLGNGENLPVANDSVDVITSIFSVQYFDINQLVDECRRVLKAGGVAIFYEEFLASIKSLEDNNLPCIVDEIKDLKMSCLETAKAKSHPDRYLLDDFEALCDSIDWPKKTRIFRKTFTVTKLSDIRNYYLSVPFWSSLGVTESNPMIKTFQRIKKRWNLDDMEMKVLTSWDAVVIVIRK